MTKPAKKPAKKPVKPVKKVVVPVKKVPAPEPGPGEAFETFHKAKAPTPESHPELFDIFGNRL